VADAAAVTGSPTVSDGGVDLVLDASPPKSGTIAQLIATVEDPSKVMTISNHAEARSLGARVNLDERGGAVPAATFLPQYATLAAKGKFRIPIARTYPLSEWRDAVALSQSGHPHGKVVLLP
jgi:NADPH:quinone reductase-like Zn-dependent oxidoreductase